MIKNLISFFIRRFKVKRIKVVHDDDLERLLNSLDLLDDLKSGKIKCELCDEIITKENIGAFFKEKGEVKIICDQTSCNNKL